MDELARKILRKAVAIMAAGAGPDLVGGHSGGEGVAARQTALAGWNFFDLSREITCRAGALNNCGNMSFAKDQFHGRPWSKLDDSILAQYYEKTPDSKFSLAELAGVLVRSEVAVALRASRIGVSGKRTDPNNFSDSHRASMRLAQRKLGLEPAIKAARSKSTKAWLSVNPHPKGMLGKLHSQKAKDAISKAKLGTRVPPKRTLQQMKTRLERFGTLVNPRMKTTWKQGWRDVGGKRVYFRSKWEANYGRFLEFQKQNGLIKSWDHEPKTFWFEKIRRGCRSYLPDFRVVNTDCGEVFHEVKGWMDRRSVTKLKRMKKYYPAVALIVKDAKWYRQNSRLLKKIVPGWE